MTHIIWPIGNADPEPDRDKFEIGRDLKYSRLLAWGHRVLDTHKQFVKILVVIFAGAWTNSLGKPRDKNCTNYYAQVKKFFRTFASCLNIKSCWYFKEIRFQLN